LSAQSLVRRPHHRPADGSLIGELHFCFGWMDVDIDCRRVEVNPDHSQRMPSDHQQRMKRLFQRVTQGAMLNHPTIYEKE
jgi:hypothetical protein